MSIAAVVIGRNEGARLVACLEALEGQVDRVVYVDSGSDDGSVAHARQTGAEVVALDMTQPFTAARARNAGVAALGADVTYIQFLDGDCALRAGWIDVARAHLDAHPEGAVVCGRRRERAPEASVYNGLIDAEWDTPVGEAKACGGDALMRAEAVRQVGGYRDSLIAGEEPELCVRLRQAGWQIWRLDAEMTWHDADIHRFGQWWRRSKRAGHAFAEGAALHGAPPERHWVQETRRAVIWGGVLPLAILLAALLTGPAALLLLLIYPAQVLRLGRRDGWRQGLFSVVGKFAECAGVLTFHWRRLRNRDAQLIEYK
ncbi:glycosyltransferase [uncultured Sulfitobacter sp.]|uniref:glycosyltransferase family 2 protein n=1 Tax=uncultured Sulfitobacter sp. TaxID=191468 RepID=UPI0026247805|nr:glycosyltransferase [uncultured Sulfitobacter sp.]